MAKIHAYTHIHLRAITHMYPLVLNDCGWFDEQLKGKTTLSPLFAKQQQQNRCIYICVQMKCYK